MFTTRRSVRVRARDVRTPHLQIAIMSPTCPQHLSIASFDQARSSFAHPCVYVALSIPPCLLNTNRRK
jgi:hypothetical protein